MRKLLILLLVTFALPIAVRTHEIAPYFLIIVSTKKEGVIKVPMASLEACKKAQKLFLKKESWTSAEGMGRYVGLYEKTLCLSSK